MLKVSIVIPVYNVELYLKQCLDSVVNQTYNNIEIVIVNDRSPDNSYRILEYYSARDPRIKVISHEVNKGLGAARNTGIKHATGDYILFLDSDDWLALDTVFELIENISQEHCDILKFGYNLVYESKILKSISINTLKSKDGWGFVKNEIKTNTVFNPICCCSIYNLQFLKINELKFPEGLLFEDFSFTTKSHILADKIRVINEHYYFYRQDRQNSIMTSLNKREEEVCETLKILNEFVYTNNLKDIYSSSEFNLLMFDWSAGTTIYRYLKNNNLNNNTKEQIIQKVLSNQYFQYYLKQISKDKSISLSRKLPIILLKTNYTLFKITYKFFIFLRGLASKFNFSLN